MSELTQLYLSDLFYRFEKYGIFSFIYQSFNVTLATLLTIILPYTPFNFMIYMFISMLIYFINPWHLSDKTTYICLTSEAIPRYQFSWSQLMKNAYYCYLFVAFILNYNVISRMKQINI